MGPEERGTRIPVQDLSKPSPVARLPDGPVRKAAEPLNAMARCAKGAATSAVDAGCGCDAHPNLTVPCPAASCAARRLDCRRTVHRGSGIIRVAEPMIAAT